MLRSPLGNENMRLLRRSASQGKNFKEFPNSCRSQNTMSFLKQSEKVTNQNKPTPAAKSATKERKEPKHTKPTYEERKVEIEPSVRS